VTPQSDSPQSTAHPTVLHGTAVAIGTHAVLLIGPSGSGKSDLALRLIDGGARLVADDRVELVRVADEVFCRAPGAIPEQLKGRIEVRGVGILPVPTVRGDIPLRWCVELVRRGGSPDTVERLPRAESKALLGLDIPLLRLFAFEASTPAKLRLAVACGPGLIMGRE
jgi:serine kinase of HPr protein (carbohydrate metabolism regulator)